MRFAANEIDKALASRAERASISLGSVTNKELRFTLDDIAIVCEMGRYYADKIRGSTYVALARESKKTSDKFKAVELLTEAAEHYKNMCYLLLPIMLVKFGLTAWEF